MPTEEGSQRVPEEEVTAGRTSAGVLRPLYARSSKDVLPLHQAFAAASRYGARPYLEDFYTAGLILDKMPLFGVFDGHGGTYVAEFCARNLLPQTHLCLLGGEAESDLHKALRASFLQMDELLWPKYEQSMTSALGSQEEEECMCPGSTAVVAVVDYDRQRVVVANVGDSRAILSRNGTAVDMARAQEPEDAAERARIKAAGAKILANGYVSTADEASTLGMSRSIGDFEFKMDASRNQEQQAVIAVPEIVEEKLIGCEEFLVLTSDGIWMPSQEIVDFVAREWKQGLSLPLLCNRLMDKADANDNMTVVVVPLFTVGSQDESTTAALVQ